MRSSRTIPLRRRSSLRSAIATVTVLMMAGSLGLLGALPAHANPAAGSISGTVTAGGMPVQGIEVYAIDGGSWTGPATSGIDGQFTITALPDASYTVRFQSSDLAYVDVQFQNVVVSGGGNSIQDVALNVRPNYILQGRVTDSVSGAPVAGMVIEASPEPFDSSIPNRTNTTDGNGNYYIDHLVTSHVSVTSEWSNATYQFYRGDGVGVGATPTTLNLTLTPIPTGDGVISGTVRDYETGNPILGPVTVQLSTMSGFNLSLATNPADGTYQATNLPLQVITAIASGPYNGDYTQTQTQVVLSQVESSRTRDIYLKKIPRGNSTLTGTVSEAGPGGTWIPVEFASVSVDLSKGGMPVSMGFVNTGADGKYSLAQLPSGSFNLSVFKFGAVAYKDAHLTFSSNGTDDVTEDIIVERVPTGSGSVSGTLTDRRTSLPIPQAQVMLTLPGDSSVRKYSTTDNDGKWAADALPDGDYSVSIWDPSNTHEGELNIPVLHIVGGNHVDRTDTLTSLAPSNATLSGRIKDATTYLGISGADVTITRVNGGTPNLTATTDANGDYLISVIPAGSYTVSVSKDGFSNIDGAVDIDTDEAATYGARLTSRPIIPSGEGTISGTVLDAHGQPLANASVNAYAEGAGNRLDALGWGSATTDADGKYLIEGLALTDFSLWVNGPYGDDSLATQSASASLSLLHKDVVRDFTLQAAATISGSVTKVGGGAPDNVTVMAVDSNGYVWPGSMSATGQYSIPNLSPGAYTVWAGLSSMFVPGPDDPSYASAYWSDVNPHGSALSSGGTPVTVGAGDISGGHDMELLAGAKISGVVFVSAGASVAALPQGKQLVVHLYRQDGSSWILDSLTEGRTEASLSGKFELSGLSAGNYKLEFEDTWTGNRAYQTIYNSSAATLADAPIITVGPGENVLGQNVTMKTKVPTADSNTVGNDALVGGAEGQVGAPGSATTDETITVNVGKDMAGEWVSLWAHSTPTALSGWVEVAADGTVTTTIPSSLPAGNHRLVVQDADDAVVGWTGISISASAAPGGGTQPGSAAQPGGGGPSGSTGGDKPSVAAPQSQASSIAGNSGATSNDGTLANSSPSTPKDSTKTEVTSEASGSLNWGIIFAILAIVLLLGIGGGTIVVIRGRRT